MLIGDLVVLEVLLFDCLSFDHRALEDENGKLKRMLADAMLDNVALKDLLGKKW
jgi:hypothetical protein